MFGSPRAPLIVFSSLCPCSFHFLKFNFLLFEHFWLWVELGTYEATAKVQLLRSHLSLCQNLDCVVFFLCFLFYFESLLFPLYRIFTSPLGSIDCSWDSPVSCSPVYLNPPSRWFPFLVCLVVWFFSPFLTMTTLSVKEDVPYDFYREGHGLGKVDSHEREAILASMISWRSTQTQTTCDTLLTPNEVMPFGLRFRLLYLYL